MMKSTLGLFMTVAIFLPIPCYAELHSSVEVKNLRTECVGRFQVDVPGDVEVALSSYKHFFDSIGTGEYRFSDNTNAPFSSYHYYGKLGITSESPKTDFEH